MSISDTYMFGMTSFLLKEADYRGHLTWMVTHSKILAWKTPWTEKPGRLQSMGSQRVGYDCVTSFYFILFNLDHADVERIPGQQTPESLQDTLESLRGQNYFNNNIQLLFVFFTMLTFTLMLQS